jgi:hypothetical protein
VSLNQGVSLNSEDKQKYMGEAKADIGVSVNPSAKAERLAEEFLKALLGVSPGFNRLILTLYLLHKREYVNIKHLKAFLGEDIVDVVKDLNFLEVYVDENEDRVSMKVGGPAWRLLEAVKEFIESVEETEWPDKLRRRYVCLAKSIPAALQTLAILKSVEEGLERMGVARGLSKALAEIFSKAINDGRLAFNIEEIDTDVVNTIIKDYGRDYLDSLLNELSGLGAFNYLEEPGMIILDPDVVEGLKKALKECSPSLNGIGVNELEKWIEQISKSFS